MSKVIYVKEDQTYVFSCPHCDGQIQVGISDVNCSIFRHAVYKNTCEQINPHLPEILCKDLIQKGIVHGCAKPFRLIPGTSGIIERAEICDYI